MPINFHKCCTPSKWAGREKGSERREKGGGLGMREEEATNALLTADTSVRGITLPLAH